MVFAVATAFYGQARESLRSVVANIQHQQHNRTVATTGGATISRQSSCGTTVEANDAKATAFSGWGEPVAPFRLLSSMTQGASVGQSPLPRSPITSHR